MVLNFLSCTPCIPCQFLPNNNNYIISETRFFLSFSSSLSCSLPHSSSILFLSLSPQSSHYFTPFFERKQLPYNKDTEEVKLIAIPELLRQSRDPSVLLPQLITQIMSPVSTLNAISESHQQNSRFSEILRDNKCYFKPFIGGVLGNYS